MAETPLADTIRAHLAETGQSRRALSLAAGLNASEVSAILGGRTARPTPAVIDGLSRATGLDLAALPPAATPTVATARAFLAGAPAGWSAARRRGATSALGCYARHAGDLAPVDRAAVRRFLTRHPAAALGVAPETRSIYATHLRALVDALAGAARPTRIDDLTGPWRALRDRAAGLGLPVSLQRAAGPLCAWCAGQAIAPARVDAATFLAWRDHRVATGRLTVTETAHTAAARRALAWWNRLAARADFADLGVAPVASPFADRRRRYAGSDGVDAAILAEYDARVAPWLAGRCAPDGAPVEAIIDAIEATALAPADPLRAAARRYTGAASQSRRAALADRLQARGVLVGGRTWCARRIANARASIACMVRACHHRTGGAIASFAELTDPEIAEAAATALEEGADAEGLGSTYVTKLVEMLRKIAEGYVGRPARDVEALRALARDFDPGFEGIAPRNMRKLRQFTPDRLAAFFDLSHTLVAEMNVALARRRAEIRRAEADGRDPPPLVDLGLARRHAVIVAHDILCARAPRASNLCAIDLARHVRRRADGRIAIELPAEIVKSREPLTILLSPARTARFDQYVKSSRPVLASGAAAGSTLLFPSTISPDLPSTHLLDRLVAEVARRIGVRIHPHLYRHLIGWAWLRKDPRRLPQVQTLLGHKKIATTQRFYAELDAELAQQDWADYLEGRLDDDDLDPL